MALRLRLHYQHLGRTRPVVASSEAAGFPASNLETGNRHLFWRGSAVAEQTLTVDAGVGQMQTPDTLIIPRLDLLIAAGASLDVQNSADAATGWATVGGPFPRAPVTAADLQSPTGTDGYYRWDGTSKRGNRLRIYGSLTAAPTVAGGWYLGPSVEIVGPQWGQALGVGGPSRGQEWVPTWGLLGEAEAATLMAGLQVVAPDDAEGPYETVAGVVYGGLPHYWYDPTGRNFGQQGTPTPWLWPAMCLTRRSQLFQTTVRPGFVQGPSVRFRQRV